MTSQYDLFKDMRSGNICSVMHWSILVFNTHTKYIKPAGKKYEIVDPIFFLILHLENKSIQKIILERKQNRQWLKKHQLKKYATMHNHALTQRPHVMW